MEKISNKKYKKQTYFMTEDDLKSLKKSLEYVKKLDLENYKQIKKKANKNMKVA